MADHKATGGFKSTLLQLKDEVGNDNIAIVAAGVAFYFFLALFPALAAAVSIFGLINDPADVQQQMEQLNQMLPDQAHEIISERLKNLTQTSGEALGWGTALSILLSLWSANSGTKSLFQGVNIAYNIKNERNFFKQSGFTLLFTLAGMIIGFITLGLIVAFPALVGNLGLPETIRNVIGWGRWPLLAFVIMFCFAALYKYAPYHHAVRFRWISWGSAVATFLWLIGSWAFSFYVENFGSYNKMYGSFAAVIILMLYFNLTCFIILLGAEINSVMENHKRKNTIQEHPISSHEQEKRDSKVSWTD